MVHTKFKVKFKIHCEKFYKTAQYLFAGKDAIQHSFDKVIDFLRSFLLNLHFYPYQLTPAAIFLPFFSRAGLENPTYHMQDLDSCFLAGI